MRCSQLLSLATSAILASGIMALPPNNSVITVPNIEMEVDLIVVGGGFSGLMAAYEATQAGLNTLALEAKHRTGGRSRSQPLGSNPGAVIEMGATWINEYTQPTIFGLCQKFGLETAEQYIDGYTVYEDGEGQIRKRLDNNQTEHASFSVGAPDAEQDPLTAFVMLIAMAAAERDIYRFDDFPAEEDVSLADWVAKKDKALWDNSAVRGVCRQLSSAVVGREPEEIGAHYFLDYLQSGYGYESIASEGAGGAQSLKVKKGTSAISDSLVAAMPPGTIILNSPVNTITQVPAGDVYVSTSNGHHYKSRKVILANPTNTYKNIRFSPRLPKSKDTLVSNTKPGIYAKVIMTYSSPWWREAGLVGKFESVTGPICFSWDVSDLDAKQYSLAFFVAGKVAAAWHELSEPAKEEAIIEHLARLVGPELAANARDVVEMNTVEWTKEEHIWGGPTSAMGPGMLRKYGHALREPFGRLHFAGGETAYEWKGYLEGAITSGKRAAEEVIDSLDRGK